MARFDTAQIVSISETNWLEQSQQWRDDALDIVLATARMLTTGPERLSLDDVINQFGYSRAQLRELDE